MNEKNMKKKKTDSFKEFSRTKTKALWTLKPGENENYVRKRELETRQPEMRTEEENEHRLIFSRN